jgi:hypothetical protein
VALAVSLAGGALWLRDGARAPAPARPRVAAPASSSPELLAPPAATTESAAASTTKVAARPTGEVSPRVTPKEPGEEKAQPHPLGPRHERLRRERHFVARLDDAVDARSGALLREALEEYRREFPEDEQRLQAGYAVIADCLDGGSEMARQVAERFYEQHRGSSLRRWVRRVCLES